MEKRVEEGNQTAFQVENKNSVSNAGKIKYVFGIIAAMFCVMGALFKVHHYPGASLMLIIGVFVFTLVLFILLFSKAIKDARNKKNLIKYRLGVISILLICLGLLFKLGNVPLGSILLSLGVLTLFIRIFMAFFSVEGRKKFVDYFGLFCLSIISMGLLFKVQHYPGASSMLIVGMTSFVIFLPIYFSAKFKDLKPADSTNILDLIIITSIIISLILPINVSREVLDAFVLINHGLVATTDNTVEQNEMIYANFEKADSDNTQLAEPWIRKAFEVKTHADQMVGYLEELKIALVIEIEGLESGDREIAIQKLKTKEGIQNKSNTDIPAMMMINEGRAKQLKEEIVMFSNFICSMIKPRDTKLKDSIAKSLSTNDPLVTEIGYLISWESENFEYLPAIAVITNLSQIQSQIRHAEYKIITYLEHGI